MTPTLTIVQPDLRLDTKEGALRPGGDDEGIGGVGWTVRIPSSRSTPRAT